MNRSKPKEPTYKAVALAGSLAAPCGATLLLVEHQDKIHKLVDHQIQLVESKKDFPDYVKQGYAFKLPRPFPIPLGTQAWFLNFDWKKTYQSVLREMSSALQPMANPARGRPLLHFKDKTIELILADPKTIASIRERLAKHIQALIDAKMVQAYAQSRRRKQPVSWIPPQATRLGLGNLEKWAWLGSFCAGPVSSPNLYYSFMLALGFVYSQRADVISEKRLFEFSVHKFYNLSPDQFNQDLDSWRRDYRRKADDLVVPEFSAKLLDRTTSRLA